MFSIPKNSYEVRFTLKKGRGVFALKKIKAESLIGEYKGEHIPYHEINPQDYEYLIYLNNEYGIVADKKKVGVHLLNHSCEPNCKMDITKKDIKFVTLRKISPQEELTISYNYPPLNSCTNCIHQCFCGSSKCSGSMHPLINKT